MKGNLFLLCGFGLLVAGCNQTSIAAANRPAQDRPSDAVIRRYIVGPSNVSPDSPDYSQPLSRLSREVHYANGIGAVYHFADKQCGRVVAKVPFTWSLKDGTLTETAAKNYTGPFAGSSETDEVLAATPEAITVRSKTDGIVNKNIKIPACTDGSN
jgi:hypothetical protein